MRITDDIIWFRGLIAFRRMVHHPRQKPRVTGHFFRPPESRESNSIVSICFIVPQ